MSRTRAGTVARSRLENGNCLKNQSDLIFKLSSTDSLQCQSLVNLSSEFLAGRFQRKRDDVVHVKIFILGQSAAETHFPFM